jgi:hypothetical protein
MTSDCSDDEWLNPGFVACPSCGIRLFRVDHSPFYDEWWLYCTRCPRHAEVSYYAPIVAKLRRDGAIESRIEALLRPCTCGGTFSFAASRRCPSCSSVVLAAESGADIFPEVFGAPAGPDGEPSEQQTAEAEAFERNFVRREDLW